MNMVLTQFNIPVIRFLSIDAIMNKIHIIQYCYLMTIQHKQS